MRKALILFASVALLAVAIQVPDSITGFFMSLTTSIFDLIKEVLKQILLAIANAL